MSWKIQVGSCVPWGSTWDLLKVISPCLPYRVCPGFCRWLSGRESTCNEGDIMRLEFDPWVRKIPWRKGWQATPLFLPGESPGQRSLADYIPWGLKEPDTTEQALAGLFTESSASWELPLSPENMSQLPYFLGPLMLTSIPSTSVHCSLSLGITSLLQHSVVLALGWALAPRVPWFQMPQAHWHFSLDLFTFWTRLWSLEARNYVSSYQIQPCIPQ